MNIRIDNVEEFIELDNDMFFLRKNLIIDGVLDNSDVSLKTKLEELAGEDIINHCKNLNIEGFTLEKIYETNPFPVDRIKSFLNSKQLEVVDKLFKDNSLIVRWEENSIYDDFQVIGLTFLGKEKFVIICSMDC